MDRDENIKILLAEEAILLSRERTMHSYMRTGLTFNSVGLVILKLMTGTFYFLYCRIRLHYRNIAHHRGGKKVCAFPERCRQSER
jgi:hypothetical protein